MPQITVPLVATFGSVGARSWSIERPINCYLQPAEHGSKTQLIIKPSSGLKLRATAASGRRVRGGVYWQGDAYFVIGDTLYKHERDSTLTALEGDPILGFGAVSMATNTTQICVVDPESTEGYVASDDPMTVAQIIDADWPGASSVAVLDSIGIFEVPNSDEFQTSAINDFTKIDALDFAAAERNPDINVRVLVDHAELWVMGEETIEIFQNVGGSFPFRRIPAGIIERGCASRFSVTKDDNSVFWLGNDGIFYRAAGYTPQRISNHAVEEVLEGQIVTDAECFNWTEAGSKFVAWRFPSIGRTLVFDVSTGLWHERTSGKTSSDNWRGLVTVEAWGKTLLGDSAGKIYELDANTHDEAGDVRRSQMVFAPIYENGRRVFHQMLDVEMEVGRGLTTGQGSDPKIMLDYSDDGSTFSNELWRSTGKIGEYRKRVRWHRLGSSFERTYRLTITDPVAWAVMDAKLTAGMSSR